MKGLESAMRGAHLSARRGAESTNGTYLSLQLRMSGLSKVEMSAFIGGRGPYGNGANRLEPTRPGPAARATEGQAVTAHADGTRKPRADPASLHTTSLVSAGGRQAV